ncbi:MAG: hypothetical protein HQL86_08930, partial [Magnetococcales bacterium]|nr:hypothetical protein [Magnetococcales bacterium]
LHQIIAQQLDAVAVNQSQTTLQRVYQHAGGAMAEGLDVRLMPWRRPESD